MNYVVLEGIGFWAALFIALLLIVISLVSILCAVLADKRIFTLEALLYKENKKVRYLIRQNFVLQLKCGEFDFNEE